MFYSNNCHKNKKVRPVIFGVRTVLWRGFSGSAGHLDLISVPMHADWTDRTSMGQMDSTDGCNPNAEVSHQGSLCLVPDRNSYYQDFPEELQSLPRWTYPSGPAASEPLPPELIWTCFLTCFDPIRT